MVVERAKRAVRTAEGGSTGPAKGGGATNSPARTPHQHKLSQDAAWLLRCEGHPKKFIVLYC